MVFYHTTKKISILITTKNEKNFPHFPFKAKKKCRTALFSRKNPFSTFFCKSSTTKRRSKSKRR